MLNSRHLVLFTTVLLSGLPTLSPADIVGFEDLPSLPGATGATDLYQANNESLTYDGIVWDSRLTVVGVNHAIADGGPLYSGGAPGGGSYYISNSTAAPSYGQGIVLTTTKVLKGAYFGSVEYYGFHTGEGASQVSISAMHDSTTLGTLNFTLVPNTQTGGGTNTAQPMTYFDTSSFSSLTGITSYVINRTNPNEDPTNANWVADNFDFGTASVPEPSNDLLALSCVGLVVLFAGFRRMRT